MSICFCFAASTYIRNICAKLYGSCPLQIADEKH